MALLWDSPVPPVLSLLLPDVTPRQEWLFWAPSWHDRLQTISDLKRGWGVKARVGEGMGSLGAWHLWARVSEDVGGERTLGHLWAWC